MTSESDWAAKAAGRFREQQNKKQLEHNNALEEQKLLTEQGNRLWSQVRDAIRDRGQLFNKEMEQEILVYEVIQNVNLQMRRPDSSSCLDGHYDQTGHLIHFEVSNPMRSVLSYNYKIALNPKIRQIKLMDRTNLPREPEEVAETILNEFLQKG